MPGCSVPLCKNRSEDKIKMHKNPVKVDRLEKWRQYLRENDFNRDFPGNFFICDVHFGVKCLDNGIVVPEKDPSVPKKRLATGN